MPVNPRWLAWLRYDVLLAVFLSVYVACGIGAQVLAWVQQSIPPSEEGAPIEAFTAGLLWMIALYGLLQAARATARGRDLLFWLAFTAAVGALAVDEVVGIHESTEPAFNDDWVKVAMWIGTPLVLWYIAKIESTPRASRIAMFIGFGLQAAYVVVELGDGEVFSLPWTVETLKWSEEIFELLFLAAYAFALWIVAFRNDVQALGRTEPTSGETPA